MLRAIDRRPASAAWCLLVCACACACAPGNRGDRGDRADDGAERRSSQAAAHRETREDLDMDLATAVAPATDVYGAPSRLLLNPTADVERAGILAEGAEGSGEIALTFDDGPSVENTPEVLRILAAHRMKGAFFVNGSRLAGTGVVAEVHRRLAVAIARAGHTIGNHGLDHLALDQGDPAWITFQIDASAARIADATGLEPHLFRPPYGRVGEAARAELAARGDELVTWTIDAQDTLEPDPEHLAHRLEQQLLFAGQGIVLLHDLHGSSVRALSILLDWIERHPRREHPASGFRVVDLPTYLADAAAHPYPYPTRAALLRARERSHAASIERPTAGPLSRM